MCQPVNDPARPRGGGAVARTPWHPRGGHGPNGPLLKRRNDGSCAPALAAHTHACTAESVRMATAPAAVPVAVPAAAVQATPAAPQLAPAAAAAADAARAAGKENAGPGPKSRVADGAKCASRRSSFVVSISAPPFAPGVYVCWNDSRLPLQARENSRRRQRQRRF